MKTYTIGREAEAMIQCGDDTVSTIHAEITVTDDERYYLVDRCSKNGTKVLTDEGFRPHTKDYVAADAVILLGEFRTTVSQLMALVQPMVERYKRNPKTGTIVKVTIPA